MFLRKPKEFERVAREWAVLYAGAPRGETSEGSRSAAEETQEAAQDNVAQYVPHAFKVFTLTLSRRYVGYNKDLVDRFCSMGFDVERVVGAFQRVGVDRRGGQDYGLNEGQMGDVTSQLLGE
jgi:ubiquitin-conjugating enzyme (huntingtin interacting protein 2)